MSVIHSNTLPKEWNKTIDLPQPHEQWQQTLVFVDVMPEIVDLTVRMSGAGSRADLTIIYVGRNTDQIKMNVTFMHDARDTYGRVKARAVLYDAAQFVLSGMLDITEQGDGSDTHFLGKGLLMSPSACAEIHPHLEIKTDAVRAAHGASVGRVDAQSLFYLQSRGLDKNEAEQILLSEFFRDAVSGLSRDEQKQFYEQVI